MKRIKSWDLRSLQFRQISWIKKYFLPQSFHYYTTVLGVPWFTLLYLALMTLTFCSLRSSSILFFYWEEKKLCCVMFYCVVHFLVEYLGDYCVWRGQASFVVGRVVGLLRFLTKATAKLAIHSTPTSLPSFLAGPFCFCLILSLGVCE